VDKTGAKTMPIQMAIRKTLIEALLIQWNRFRQKGQRSLVHWFLTTPFGLRSKLVMLFGLLFTIVIFMVSLFSFDHQRYFLAQEVEKRGELLASNLALTSRDAVLGHDLLTLSSLIGAIQKDNDVVSAYIVDLRNVIIMHSDITQISKPHVHFVQIQPDSSSDSTIRHSFNGSLPIIEISQPIRYGTKVIGRAYIELNQTRVEEIMEQAKRRLLWTMGLGLSLGMVGIFLLSNVFLRPVAHLVRATGEIASGNLKFWVPVKSRDELGLLGASFNSMVGHLRAAYEDVERGYLETTRALAAAVEAKDSYTKGHCERVHSYAFQIGSRLGFSKHDLKELELTAILHDIGKIGIKDEILMKPNPLSFEEMQMMHLHPEIGRQILENVENLRQVAINVHCHHEFVNGKGYPQGLKGEKIPVISRIITVVDAYDSMSSRRPYRDPLSEDEIRRRLLRGKGRQFDPVMLEIFLNLLDAGILEKIKTQYRGSH
jgi:HD-GYP domain-containing protein (c-di-GMP phosphodiesterase class II)